MSTKKPERLPKRMWQTNAVNERRAKDLILNFYPGGKLAAFVSPSQVVNTLMESGVVKRFSEDENYKSYCRQIIKNARIKCSGDIDIDLFPTEMNFGDTHLLQYEALFMFTVTGMETPIYTFVSEDIDYDSNCMLRFLASKTDVNGSSYLVLDDMEQKMQNHTPEALDGELEGISSFVSLSDFHAIIRCYDDKDHGLSNALIVSFVRDDYRCIIEELSIYDLDGSYINTPDESIEKTFFEEFFEAAMYKCTHPDSSDKNKGDTSASDKSKVDVSAARDMDDSDINAKEVPAAEDENPVGDVEGHQSEETETVSTGKESK